MGDEPCHLVSVLLVNLDDKIRMDHILVERAFTSHGLLPLRLQVLIKHIRAILSVYAGSAVTSMDGWSG